MRPFVRRFSRSERGTAMIEFALIVPVMLVLLAALVEFASIIKIYNQLNRIATQYAVAWADCTDGPILSCAAELSAYTSPFAIRNLAPNLDQTQLTLQMFELNTATTADKAVIYAYPSGSAPSAGQTAAALRASTTQKVVLVTVTYTHTLMFFPNLMTTYLSAHLHPTFTAVQLVVQPVS